MCCLSGRRHQGAVARLDGPRWLAAMQRLLLLSTVPLLPMVHALVAAASVAAATSSAAAWSGGGSDAPCVLSIEDYGAVSGVNGSHAAFTNADAINRTLAKAAGTPGCTVLIPSGRYVAFGGIIGLGLVDTTLRFDGTLVAEFSTTQWPGCPEHCEAFLTIQGAHNITLTSSQRFPPGFPTVPSSALSDLSAPIHPIRTAGGLIDGMGAKWWCDLLTSSLTP